MARRFGLGEKVVCKNAGYFLQGNDMIERPVYRAASADCGERKVIATTLQEILHEEVENEEWWTQEVYWKELEWRHIQLILDESGGQSERFRLLAKILDHIAEVELMEGIFVPYGNQFADSEFLMPSALCGYGTRSRLPDGSRHPVHDCGRRRWDMAGNRGVSVQYGGQVGEARTDTHSHSVLVRTLPVPRGRGVVHRALT